MRIGGQCFVVQLMEKGISTNRERNSQCDSVRVSMTSVLIISLHMINVCFNFHSDSKLTPSNEYLIFGTKIHNCTAWGIG